MTPSTSCWPTSTRPPTSRRPPPTGAASPRSSLAVPSATPGARRMIPHRGQRPRLRARRRAAAHARRLPARRPEPHRHARRLRARLLRLLQRPRRRRGDPLLPDVRRPGRRPLRRDRGRHLAAPDGTLSELQQAFTEHHALQCGFCTPAMLLDGDRVPARPPRRDGARGDQRGDRRRHLPLHGLPADRPGHPVGGGEGMTIEQHPGAAKIAADTAQKEAARSGSARASTA